MMMRFARVVRTEAWVAQVRLTLPPLSTGSSWCIPQPRCTRLCLFQSETRRMNHKNPEPRNDGPEFAASSSFLVQSKYARVRTWESVPVTLKTYYVCIELLKNGLSGLQSVPSVPFVNECARNMQFSTYGWYCGSVRIPFCGTYRLDWQGLVIEFGSQYSRTICASRSSEKRGARNTIMCHSASSSITSS